MSNPHRPGRAGSLGLATDCHAVLKSAPILSSTKAGRHWFEPSTAHLGNPR
jgi:hypothetical protein